MRYLAYRAERLKNKLKFPIFMIVVSSLFANKLAWQILAMYVLN